ncbi:unnamed protein product (macronuclear) [Paramecium tetraurelia]|uniref:Uncharacterized protein n=1 Tax=Paramecium tetraurelia TaxID=5888 RepID=A0C1U0_PARTE|nr:uncharacterized protein GSPATT00034234001 [Paramecium tetraurelia]CAK64757.1 unnamed protein product [Paramecium tetraurelia]|eukprot:XP_001432154.1 hypothetical protein (macronuclear) [Paramecium tetraurelia strain d4-2]
MSTIQQPYFSIKPEQERNGSNLETKGFTIHLSKSNTQDNGKKNSKLNADPKDLLIILHSLTYESKIISYLSNTNTQNKLVQNSFRYVLQNSEDMQQ